MLCYDISNCLHQYTSRSKSFNTFVFSTITISILRVCKISHILLYCQQSYRFRRQTIRKISLHDCRKICKQTTCKEYINLKSKVNEKVKRNLNLFVQPAPINKAQLPFFHSFRAYKLILHISSLFADVTSNPTVVFACLNV